MSQTNKEKSTEKKQPEPRWCRGDNRLAAYLDDTSKMTIWRWRRDPSSGFPPAATINGMKFTDLNLVDAWLKKRALARTGGAR
jgi:hypothetical protein